MPRAHAPDPTRRLLDHLDEGDTAAAETAALALPAGPLPRARIRRAFVALMGRRGYFVSTPRELAASLEEIREVGEGFDLFDLAIRFGLLPIPRKETRHERSA